MAVERRCEAGMNADAHISFYGAKKSFALDHPQSSHSFTFLTKIGKKVWNCSGTNDEDINRVIDAG
jgi:hypothetical protein